MAEPLTVRQVRLVPSIADQSSEPQVTAELAEQVSASDGAPEALALPETPTPPWSRQTVTPKL